jgi:aspartate/methionine/tyrosine aminotransferase
MISSRRELEAVRPEKGSIMFPRVKHGQCEALLELLREKFEMTVVPGKFFELPDHFRIGMGGDTETFTAGLERLAKALDELTT